MKNCQTREGDRFYYTLHDVILEMVLVDGIESVKLIKDGKNGWNHPPGYICVRYPWTQDNNPELWKYLGNFSKTDNFNRLYEKLL